MNKCNFYKKLVYQKLNKYFLTENVNTYGASERASLNACSAFVCCPKCTRDTAKYTIDNESLLQQLNI